MTEKISSPLSNIIELGKVDTIIGRIIAERRALEGNLKTKGETLASKQKIQKSVLQDLTQKKEKYLKEDKSIKEEREKLVARRKALASINNYKVQQAAEKEIEHASKQIDVREESLLLAMDAVDKVESEAKSINSEVEKLLSEFNNLEREARDTLRIFAEREKDFKMKRNHIAAKINPTFLSSYERVHERYQVDPCVSVDPAKMRCEGCYIQLGPQVLVEINRSTNVVKCAGCGRILYLAEKE